MASTPANPAPSGTRMGYVRVSTGDQDLAPQVDVLRERGCDPIFAEHASGKHDDRPELARAMAALHAGDTLVVWRLDRLGRSLPDLVATVNELAARGIAFESVTEAIDTTAAAGKQVFDIFASLADFERHLVDARTRVGLAAARAGSRKGGRRSALTLDQLREAKLLLAEPKTTVMAVAERYGVSRVTLYKGLKQITTGEPGSRKGGRSPALTLDQLREAKLLLAEPKATVTAVAKRYKVSRVTLYKGLKQIATGESA